MKKLLGILVIGLVMKQKAFTLIEIK